MWKLKNIWKFIYEFIVLDFHLSIKLFWNYFKVFLTYSKRLKQTLGSTKYFIIFTGQLIQHKPGPDITVTQNSKVLPKQDKLPIRNTNPRVGELHEKEEKEVNVMAIGLVAGMVALSLLITAACTVLLCSNGMKKQPSPPQYLYPCMSPDPKTPLNSLAIW